LLISNGREEEVVGEKVVGGKLRSEVDEVRINTPGTIMNHVKGGELLSIL